MHAARGVGTRCMSDVLLTSSYQQSELQFSVEHLSSYISLCRIRGLSDIFDWLPNLKGASLSRFHRNVAPYLRRQEKFKRELQTK